MRISLKTHSRETTPICSRPRDIGIGKSSLYQDFNRELLGQAKRLLQALRRSSCLYRSSNSLSRIQASFHREDLGRQKNIAGECQEVCQKTIENQMEKKIFSARTEYPIK
jgi:hypothetical protein